MSLANKVNAVLYQSSLAVTGYKFAMFSPMIQPLFSFVGNEGRVKHLLLLYKQIIQRYISLLRLYLTMHFVSRGKLVGDIDGRSHKMELKSCRIIQPIIQSENPSSNYLWPGGVVVRACDR